MIVKDVCMRTVVCTVQGSLFVQHLIRIKKKKKKERNQLIFFCFYSRWGHNADVQDKCMKKEKSWKKRRGRKLEKKNCRKEETRCMEERSWFSTGSVSRLKFSIQKMWRSRNKTPFDTSDEDISLWLNIFHILAAKKFLKFIQDRLSVQRSVALVLFCSYATASSTTTTQTPWLKSENLPPVKYRSKS